MIDFEFGSPPRQSAAADLVAEFSFGANRPPADAPSYEELTGRVGDGPSRWTGRPCELVPNGQIFFQQDRKDRDLYTQAGCTYMGQQVARRRITTRSDSPVPVMGSISTDAWCCQQDQVVEVFNAYVQSPEYQRKQWWGLAFAAAMILGAAYLFINREKFGAKPGGVESKSFSWAARNPDEDDRDWEDEDYE